MDRLSSQLDRLDESASDPTDPVIGFGRGDEHLVAHSQHHLSINRKLFDLAELDVLYQAEMPSCGLSCAQQPASFTPPMLPRLRGWQRLIVENFGPARCRCAISCSAAARQACSALAATSSCSSG
jgi:hypothetical protein